MDLIAQVTEKAGYLTPAYNKPQDQLYYLIYFPLLITKAQKPDRHLLKLIVIAQCKSF